MRHFQSMLIALAMLCTAAAAASDQDFKGDRIVIFRDDSAVFSAFEKNVLHDPEVAAFMGQHFAVYTVETGSPQADSMQHLGGARLEPRTVIVSPRLDNMASVIQPSLSKPKFLALLRAVNQANTQEDVTGAMVGFTAPTAENMTAWAREFYPAITEPGSTPEGLMVGLLISRDMKVLQHSVAIGISEGPVLEQLRRMLPRAAIPERPVSSGASCFGGFDSQGAKYGRYCVTWAVAPD